MSIILIMAKAISLIVVTIAAFLALATALGADLTSGSQSTAAKCAASTPRACLFMLV